MLRRLIIACAVLMPIPSFVAAAAAPEDAQVISAAALNALYKGKTWLWSSGGAYFRADGTVIAYSGSGAKASYLEGSWRAHSDGRFCFGGTWKAPSGSGNKMICFRHAAKGETIYQQTPSGEWYQFKSALGNERDEFNNVVGGDVVSVEFNTVKRAVDAEARKAQQTRGKTASAN